MEIVGDAASLERALGRAGKATDDVGSRFKGMAKMALLGAGAAGVGGLIVGLKSSVDAAKEAQASQARLQDALKNANVSYKLHGAAIDAAIQKTSRLAALDDEDLSDAFSKLVRSTGSVTKATEGMNLAADIARARHISLEAATKTVEKGLLGSETAWKKVGLVIEKGTSATDAFDKAQRQFAGSAASYGNTAAGAQEKLGVAFENLKETVGSKVLPVLTTLATKAVEVVGVIQDHWPQISDAIEAGWEKIEPIFAAFKDAGKEIADVIASNWPTISAVATQVESVIDPLLAAIHDAIKLVTDILKGDWSAAWHDAKGVVENIVKALDKVLTAAITDLGKIALKIGNAVKDKILEGVGKVGEWISTNVLDKIESAITGALGAITKAAKSLGGGFVDGIKDGLSALGHALDVAIKAPINAVIDAWNSIGIPSFHVHIPVPLAPDIDFSTPSIGLPDIPHLATGGVLGSDGVYFGHRGETVTPARETPLRGGDNHNHIYPNGREVFTWLQGEAVRDLRGGGAGLPGTAPA